MLRPPAMSAVSLILLLLAAVGCAGTPSAFTPRYGDNDEGRLATLFERLRAAPAKEQPAVAVGIGSEGSLLYGYDLLERRVLWKQPAKPRFSPIVAGNSVVTQEGDSVIARDLRTGRMRFSISATGETLVGADGAGNAVLFTLTQGTGTFAKSRAILMLDSTKRWTRELDAPVGAPALAGEVALVPWNRQYLSALTVDEGDEFARLRARDAVISHALVLGGKVFAGGEGVLTAVTQEIAIHGMRKGPHYVPPKEELPGRPEFMRDAYGPSPLAAPESAQNRIRLVFRPEMPDDMHVTLADGNLYLQFYRFVFALDQKDLGLKWVYAHEVDLVGAAVSEHGVLLADTRGEMLQLSASSGRPVFKERNSLPSMTCEFPSGLSLSGGDRDSPPTPNEVRQQLTAAAQDPDSRLVPVRLLAVKLLAQLDDPEATASLLGLCDDELTTIAVRKAACSALPDRKLGTEYILTALTRHASFLEGTNSPPVGALAKAAAAQQVKPAVPLLIAHLEDPSTPAQTLSAVVAALSDLGDPSAIEPLNDFLRLYHADPIDEHVTRALELIPGALAKLQGQGARESLTPIVDDPLGAELVRTRAQATLAKLDEQAKAAEVDPEAAQLAAAQASEQQQAAQVTKPPPPPSYTSDDVIAKALLPVRDQIQTCIKSAKPDLFQARLLLMVEDGQVLMVSVVPEQLQGCIEPLVRSQNFQRPQVSKRERVSYVIKRF
jgi:outer membrane protein assembly factor BamB/HEAT repeat protein